MKYLKRTWAEIDMDALLHNFEIIRSRLGCKLMAVVKADAYGHGAAVVARLFDSAGADMFAVSNIEEALELRQNGIEKPILILGYTPVSYVADLCCNDITQVVYSLEYGKKLSDEATSLGVVIRAHLKADTGMSRLGFDCRSDELSGSDDMVETASLPGIEIRGIFTHFATADRDNDQTAEFTNAQYCRFLKICDFLESRGIKLIEKHCCNSAGLMLHKDKQMTISRPGIILYGLTPSSNLELNAGLIPAMTFKSTVSFVKQIHKGDTVSYGRCFACEGDMTVATVAAGYADGYPRTLSNKGYVLIKGKKAKILGNVCMDQMIVDVSQIGEVTEGDEAILFGKELPAENVAELCGTINYELICGVSRRVPRIYIKNGEVLKVVDYLKNK